MTLKERCEQQLVNEFNTDPFLAAKFPKKQAEDSKVTYPNIAVVATVGKEVSVGSGIFNVNAAIEIRFRSAISQQQGSSAQVIDEIVERCRVKLHEAQIRGEYGVVIGGETETFESETIRVRTLTISLIAA